MKGNVILYALFIQIKYACIGFAAGVSTAVISWDSDKEVQHSRWGSWRASGLWWAHGSHCMALEASVGPQGLEKVSLSPYCLASLTGVQ